MQALLRLAVDSMCHRRERQVMRRQSSASSARFVRAGPAFDWQWVLQVMAALTEKASGLVRRDVILDPWNSCMWRR